MQLRSMTRVVLRVCTCTTDKTPTELLYMLIYSAVVFLWISIVRSMRLLGGSSNLAPFKAVQLSGKGTLG